jgi:16S rRNA (adenine1518-N6/adenine1519-N6)-dimethyltransferase
MVQEEVGQRITAAPGTRAYGALSVILGYWFCARLLFRVGPGNFLPHPAVQSVVLELTPYDKPPVQVKDVAALMALIRAGFAQRRKMMHHAVERLYPGASALAGHRTGIDLTRRGETLSLEEFAALSDALSADDRYVTNKP